MYRSAQPLLAAAALLIGACFAAPAVASWKSDLQNATMLKVGSLCLDNIPRGAITIDEESFIEDNATWYRFHVKQVSGISGQGARLWIASGTPDTTTFQQTCAAAMTGVKNTILQGKVDAMDAVGFVRAPTATLGMQFVFPPDNLQVTVGNVRSGLQPLFGSTMNLAGSKAWITNPTEVKVDANSTKMIGSVDLETTARTLPDVMFQFGTGAPVRATLVQGADNLRLRINLPDGVAALRDGVLQANNVSFSAPQWSVGPGLELADVTGTAHRLRLAAKAGIVSIGLDEVIGSFVSASFKDAFGVVDWDKGTVTLSEMTNPVAGSTTTPIPVNGASATKIALNAGHSVVSQGGLPLVEGASRLATMSAGADHRGTLVFDKATVGSIPLLAGRLVDGLALAYEVKGGQYSLQSGSVQARQLAAGSLHLDSGAAALPLHLGAAVPQGGRFPVPIDVDITLPAGKMSVIDGTNKLTLEARLRRLKLKGLLNLTLPIDQSQLDVAADGFQLSIDGAVAKESMVAGGTPQFVQLATDISNAAAVSVTSKAAAGVLQLAAGEMLVVHPILQLGADGGRYALDTNLESNGTVAMDYHLADGKFILTGADLRAQNIKAVQSGTAPIRAAGWTIQALNFSLAGLRYTVSTDSSNFSVTSRLVADKLSVSADSAIQGSPQELGQPYLEVHPVDRLDIASLTSTHVDSSDASLSADGFSITGLDLAAPNVLYRDGKGTEFKTTDGFALKAPNMDDNSMDADLSIGRGALLIRGTSTGTIEMKSLLLHMFGPKSNLQGDGNINLGQVEGTFASTLDVHPGCPPAPLNLYVKTSAAGAAPVTIDKGGVKAKIPLATTYVDVYNNGAYSCTWQAYRHKWLAEQCVTYIHAGCLAPGVCWGDSYVCSPEVSATIDVKATIANPVGISMRALVSQASVEMGTNDYKDNHHQLCLKGFTPVGPVVDGTTYTPQISSSVPEAFTLVNSVLQGVMSVVQGTLQSALLTFAVTVGGEGSVLFPNGMCTS